jgi:hypothetical protein
LNFPLVYTIRKIQENKEGFELNGTHQLSFCVDAVNLLGEDINIQENSEALSNAKNEADLEIDAEKTKNMFTNTLRAN